MLDIRFEVSLHVNHFGALAHLIDQVVLQRPILLEIIHRCHFLFVKLDEQTIGEDLMDGVVVVDDIAVLTRPCQHILAKGEVGFVVAQITQYGGHDIHLGDHIVLHSR